MVNRGSISELFFRILRQNSVFWVSKHQGSIPKSVEVVQVIGGVGVVQMYRYQGLYMHQVI